MPADDSRLMFSTMSFQFDSQAHFHGFVTIIPPELFGVLRVELDRVTHYIALVRVEKDRFLNPGWQPLSSLWLPGVPRDSVIDWYQFDSHVSGRFSFHHSESLADALPPADSPATQEQPPCN